MPYFRKRNGFRGEISYILPKSVISRVTKHPLIRALFFTDVGYYPTAKFHFRNRPHGTGENILILCAQGEGWYKINGKSNAVTHNKALIIPKGFSHSYGASENSPWTIYWLHFLGESCGYYLHHLPKEQYTFPVSDRAIKKASILFNGIYNILHKGYILENIISVSLELGSLLGTLLFANEDFCPNLQTESNRKIDQSINYMLDNIGNRLSLKQLANNAHLSVPQYTYLFKIKTGYPPIEYFIRLKIQKACQYLDITDMKIYNISQIIGYDDPYYFSRIFHSIIGISPQEYRKRKMS
ncbi:Arabinose operon regulatory protein [subsurface metagenome]